MLVMATRTPEQNRIYMREYRAKNREKVLAQQRKYQAAYQERKRIETKALRQKIKELEDELRR